MTEENKQGLVIGFISDGMVPTKWMMRCNALGAGTPSGIFWKFAFVEGTGYKDKGGYAEARTKVVQQAREHNAKWLFMVDTDVFPPPDAITKLMSHSKPIVTGIYYMKSHPPQPVIFKQMGDGPYWDYPVDDFFEIEGSGLGCCLINMEVFDEFDKHNLPYFKENWVYTKPDGSKIKVKVGEDHWFFIKAKELGFQPYCDSSVICDHLDVETGAIFPGEKEVERVRNKALKKHGRQDIIKREKEIYSLDPNKKTIVFYNATPAEFSGDEITKRGVGGAEGCIIDLAKELAGYYNVVVFCNCPRPGVYDGVHYTHADNTDWMKKFTTDLLIVSRNTHLLADVDFRKYFNIQQVCLWCHDMVESYVFDRLPKAIKNIDKVCALSNWHWQNIENRFPGLIPEDKKLTISNGLDTELFKYSGEEKKRKKLVYTSTPFRGLDVLLELFPQIKEQVPDAELHVFSSMKVYGNKKVDKDKDFKELYDKAKQMEGVVYHGTVPRKELAEHLKESALMVYPNHYPETMCISVAESVVANTPVVTSKKAALPETIPEGTGYLIEPPQDETYKEKFVETTVRLLNYDEEWNKMREECSKYKDTFSWEKSAKKWVENFLPEDVAEFEKSKEQEKKEESEQEIKTEDAVKPNNNKEIIDLIEEGDTIIMWNADPYDTDHIEFLERVKLNTTYCTRYAMLPNKEKVSELEKQVPSIRATNALDGLAEEMRKDYFDVVVDFNYSKSPGDVKPLIDLATKTGKIILSADKKLASEIESKHKEVDSIERIGEELVCIRIKK